MKASIEDFLERAAELLQSIGLGQVQDDARRTSVLALAGHQLRLAQAVLRRDEDEGSLEILSRLRAQHVRLSSTARVEAPELRASLRDWTEQLRRPAQLIAEFDLERSLAEAGEDPARYGAVFLPGCAALASGWPAVENRRVAGHDIDRALRLAAVQGDVFRVVATAVVAAVVGEVAPAEAILAAVTTPAFKSRTDRGGLRIVYAAVALLGLPIAEEREMAIEVSAYLLRRERPGPDEVQFLTPIALLSRRQPEEALTLYAQWLDWHDQEPDDAGLAHVARNIGCGLDLARYGPLEAALHRIANEPSGEKLVRNLGVRGNDALLLKLVDSDRADGGQCVASPRARVASVTRRIPVHHSLGPVAPVRVDMPSSSLAAAVMGQVEFVEEAPYPAFTAAMRRRKRDRAA